MPFGNKIPERVQARWTSELVGFSELKYEPLSPPQVSVFPKLDWSIADVGNSLVSHEWVVEACDLFPTRPCEYDTRRMTT